VKKGADFMRLKYEVARTGEGWDRLQQIMASARSEEWLPYTNPPAALDRLRRVYDLTMTYDPVPALEKLKMPVLAYWGGRDTFLPVTESTTNFEAAMRKAGNTKSVVRLYPTGSHSLLETETGSPSTGGKETHFLPGLWDMKIEWLRRHVKSPQPSTN